MFSFSSSSPRNSSSVFSLHTRYYAIHTFFRNNELFIKISFSSFWMVLHFTLFKNVHAVYLVHTWSTACLAIRKVFFAFAFLNLMVILGAKIFVLIFMNILYVPQIWYVYPKYIIDQLVFGKFFILYFIYMVICWKHLSC